jgi:GTP-binding protein LepA
VRGGVLLVDAAQGIEAQTLANLYLAMGADLHIIPVLNKIDLPSANPEKYAAELAGLVGCDRRGAPVSAKTGVGVEAHPQRDRQADPSPVGDADAPPRALIFDSVYDTYRGVVTYVPGDRRQAQPPRPDQDDVDRCACTRCSRSA